jgi:hypothetical protein
MISNASVARAVVGVHLDVILSTGLWGAAIVEVFGWDGIWACGVSINRGGDGSAGGAEIVQAVWDG